VYVLQPLAGRMPFDRRIPALPSERVGCTWAAPHAPRMFSSPRAPFRTLTERRSFTAVRYSARKTRPDCVGLHPCSCFVWPLSVNVDGFTSLSPSPSAGSVDVPLGRSASLWTDIIGVYLMLWRRPGHKNESSFYISCLEHDCRLIPVTSHVTSACFIWTVFVQKHVSNAN
jgi:hypothetical protein